MFLCRLFLLLLILTSLATEPSLAQDSADNSSAVVAEIRALTASINRLTEVVKSQGSTEGKDHLYQKLNLAIAYLNFRSRRIEALERDVQESRNAKAQIESTLDVWIERQQELADSDSAIISEEERLRSAEFQMRIDLIKQRIGSLDNEIVSLESRIYELQSQIDSVEEFVQENLAL